MDYRVAAFRDSAKVTQVDIFSEDPLSLDIRGENFVAVNQVLINGVPSPEFMVLTRRRLLAEVPVRLRLSAIQTVDVLLSRQGLTSTSSVSLEAVVPGARASGFTRMMQSYLKLLLTSPGEDFSDETLGGGLYDVVGSAGTQGELRAAAAQAVNIAESQMIRLQALNPSLPSSEKLRSATLLQAEFVPSTSSLNIQVRLTAMDGTTGSPVVSV